MHTLTYYCQPIGNVMIDLLRRPTLNAHESHYEIIAKIIMH